MIWTADSPFEKSKEMSRSGIIRWWEIHRIRYNVLVGLTGLVTLSLVIFVGPLAVKPGVDFEEPMGLIALPIAFGVMANLCYTAGWIVDIVFYRRTPRYKLFRIGLMFRS
jgi:hypothetical protein